ncbi:MAG: serine hydrolase [Bacteroidales bacterium]|nr:serine hydrolase [Bacteroidales bacterium]
MKIKLFIFVAALFLAACNITDSVELSGDLQVGEIVEGVLELESPDTFYFDFGADTYIYGVCDQLSVDVVVSLMDSTGVSLGSFDGPGVGPENFWFEIKEAGEYLLVVKPFEKESGSYTIELKVVEPIATEPEKRADQLFYPFSGEDVPGGVVGVISDGELVFSRAYGMANLTHDVPYQVNTPSNIGSVSKQFTAFAILLLEQQGKLSLEDDVRKHIPELPDLGKVVTLKNMLNHTNGFREVFNLMPMTGWKGEDVLLRQEVIEILKRQEELQAAPGEVYNYNNSAFILLAEIVERISGEKFPDWMEENLFGPLGMTSSVVRANPSVIIPGASQGYSPDSTGYKESGDLYSAYGAGGIYTTVEDFSKWMGNFSNPVLGGEELVARLVTVDTLNSGDTMKYALGIGVNEFRGLTFYSHGGADLAHRAFASYFPGINAGVVAMSNNASFDAGRIAIEMAELYFGDEMEPEEGEKAEEGELTDSTGVIVPESVLEAYAGKYILPGTGFALEFSVVEEGLKMTMAGQPEAKLIPESETRFKYKGIEATVEFKRDEQGIVTGAVHFQGGRDFELERVAPYEATVEELQALTGKFFSKELETFYTLELRDTTLVLLIRNTKEIKLSAVKEDTYKGDIHFIGELVFQRDETGRITGFNAANGRTTGIGFEKQ